MWWWGGRGYRWMFRLTGLPGWMRFGFSPGWGTIPPGAQYLIQTGQLPRFYAYLTSGIGRGYYPAPYPVPPEYPMEKEQEREMLEEEMKFLEERLEQIKKRLEELKG